MKLTLSPKEFESMKGFMSEYMDLIFDVSFIIGEELETIKLTKDVLAGMFENGYDLGYQTLVVKSDSIELEVSEEFMLLYMGACTKTIKVFTPLVKSISLTASMYKDEIKSIITSAKTMIQSLIKITPVFQHMKLSTDLHKESIAKGMNDIEKEFGEKIMEMVCQNPEQDVVARSMDIIKTRTYQDFVEVAMDKEEDK